MRLEAVFIAASDPSAQTELLSEGIGLPKARPGPDGQFSFSGLGTFVAIEPAGPETSAGTVTLWFRVDNVATRTDALLAQGAELVQPPTATGTETVAVMNAPPGPRLGLIADTEPT